MDNNKPLIAHLCMFSACAFWGLMAPVGKDAMTHGITGIDMVTFRLVGAALLFWVASFFVKKEHPPVKDILHLGLAGLFGLVFNQCCYTIGLSITSPINSSIVTTSMPIFAMVLSALILKEPITGKKAGGVLMGFGGALLLILTSATADNAKVGDLRGDLLCTFAQLSFALYLSMFSRRTFLLVCPGSSVLFQAPCRMPNHLWQVQSYSTDSAQSFYFLHIFRSN